MSRTHHRTDPEVARKRRALRSATKLIEESWTFTTWGGRRNRRRAKKIARAFRQHLLSLEGDAWWQAVNNVRPWLPRTGPWR